ncbi:hypothetical protein CLV28_1923 [Sediminihabitans luteus]|uniref:Vitamin K-dependent gamma-carboxylase-like protein n=1 Tax=Sediminihabitans luteus TaxID=1138585 RepID=A0A2M9CR68_9CELL|nr:hypothetical protein [Sediminihabitans luteus]PJJ74426.1 hypothetical protein CLV28_1923 [Sediminihabitans luteus]GIJ00207.1 hypothetical protein Slu03_25840 [Sediminihabitans luteus]
MSAIVRGVDRALLAAGEASRLVEVRTLVALVIGLRLATRDWTLVADRPAVLTSNLTVMSWLPAPLPASVLVALQVAGLAAVALVVAGRAPRAGFVVAWSAYLVLTALWGSSGKVMHNDVLTVLVGLVLVLGPVPPRRGTGRVPDDARWGWPPRAALAVIAVVYLFCGVQKLRVSGISWVTSDNMRWVMLQGTSPFGDGFTHAVANLPLLPSLLAAGALLLELSAPVWLAVRVARIPFAVSVAVMHTSIWAFLGLDYSAWVLTVAAVAVPLGLPRGLRLLDVRARHVPTILGISHPARRTGTPAPTTVGV